MRSIDLRRHTPILAIHWPFMDNGLNRDKRRFPDSRVQRKAGLLLLFGAPLLCVPAFAQTRLEEYALILQDPPLARQITARGRIESAQRQLRSELARRKIRIAGSVESLLNAVFVRVPRERAADLRALSGVRDAVRLPRIQRNLNVAVNLVNVPPAWAALGGMANAGAGVKIAIVDSGIDNTQPAFQDASLQPPDGYPLGQTAYTNGKILVARSYEPMFALPDDTTPRDRSGHGTALATIAAGETNTGPLAAITGVAPKAWLGNYKIFGTPGVNDTTTFAAAIQALEDAVADHMDIALVAFGSLPLSGPLDGDCLQSGVPAAYQTDCDILAQAVENAVALGMTVVAAAGNDAQSSLQPPALNSIDSPGTAPSAITVGASTNAHILFAAVQLNGSSVPSNLETLDAVVGDGVKLTGPLTATLQTITQTDPTGLACSALPGGSLTGTIVLIERGNCDFSTKIDNAQQAGAIGVVLYQDPSHPADPPFSALGAGNTGIPAMMIYYADGQAVQAYLASAPAPGPNVQGTLNPALHVESAISNLVTDFTSRGPSIDYSIKPELVAVGQGIYTATESLDPVGDLYDPTGYTTVQGSSFAAAMVAGAAALVKQANPGFTPAQIKSALVNTASIDSNDIADDSDSGELLITSVGAGKLNAAAGLAVGVTVQPATVSFGWAGSKTAQLSPVALTITNTGKAAAAFRISVVPDMLAPDPDATDGVTVSPGSLQLEAGQQGVVYVSLAGHFTVPGIYDGVIALAGPGANLRVPYWYLESDGVPFDILPVYDSSFSGTVGDTCWYLAFKVVDAYGIAVSDQSAAFSVAQGSGAQSTSASCPAGMPPGPSAQTNAYGIAWTNVDLGSAAGDQVFQGQAGGLTTTFNAAVRPAPSIGVNGVVDAASSRVGKGLAPGSYISIYGTALSDATQSLSTGFLPFSMSGVSVSFASPDGTQGWPGRLWYVSPTQINLQIPWELQGLTSVQLAVNIADVSVPYTIPIAPCLPAMFVNNGLAIAQDRNYQLVTAGNPAQPGQYIVLYANGLGAVDNPPPSGEPTPSQPLAATLALPTVTIGGAAAQVLFSGLTPGSIGLYQIDVVVPTAAPAGLQTVVIAQNGVDSAPANLPVQ
ncbi:MAG: S8 family serine peptidase [Bryobacteraceae bacterium]